MAWNWATTNSLKGSSLFFSGVASTTKLRDPKNPRVGIQCDSRFVLDGVACRIALGVNSTPFIYHFPLSGIRHLSLV